MKGIFLLILLSFNSSVFAQSNAITGIVIDAENNQPIPVCNVFISNTALGMVTSDAGSFTLQNVPWYNSLRLVVSRIGYETFTYDFSPKQLPLNLKISLNKKILEMENVQIIPYEKDGWQKWNYIFLKLFIGESENAYDCQIDNTYDIKFRNNTRDGILEAHSDGFLIIRNFHLNYLIRYQLEKFEYNFKTQRVSYSGYPLFQEMEPNQPLLPEYSKRRSAVYYGSLTHFFKSLYANKLMEEGFEVRKMERFFIRDTILNDKKSAHPFYYYDSSGRKKFPPYRIANVWKDSIADLPLPRDSFLLKGTDSLKNLLTFDNYLAVIYFKEEEPKRYKAAMRYTEPGKYQFTRIKILNDQKKIFIEPDGSYNPGFDLLVEGYLGWEKVGDSLPMDYVLDAEVKKQ